MRKVSYDVSFQRRLWNFLKQFPLSAPKAWLRMEGGKMVETSRKSSKNQSGNGSSELGIDGLIAIRYNPPIQRL